MAKIKNKLSGGLRKLFSAEIGNEHIEETGQSRDGRSAPGGVNPATLGTALDSVNQGYVIDGENMDAIASALRAMIRAHGEDVALSEFME